MATFFCVTFPLICIYFLPFLCPLIFWGFSFRNETCLPWCQKTKKKKFFVRGHMQKATLLAFRPKQKKQKW
jgi:hypothetical protein